MGTIETPSSIWPGSDVAPSEPASAANARMSVSSGGTSVVSGDAEQALVLVADDDPCTRHLFRRFLEGAGFRVIEAADGAQAMSLMSDTIGVALFDLKMPKASGLDCLRFVRERFPDTSALVISASGQIPDAVEAMKQGAVDYLTKPVDQDELLPRV